MNKTDSPLVYSCAFWGLFYRFASDSTIVSFLQDLMILKMVTGLGSEVKLTPPDVVQSFHVQYLPHPHSGISASISLKSTVILFSNTGDILDLCGILLVSERNYVNFRVVSSPLMTCFVAR